ADRAFCEGLNRITFHGFSHSPPEAGFPGRTYHAGYDLNPRVTWWPMARPFIDYLARCSHLLQQGKSAADVCYYYGDQAPNFFPKFHDVPAKPRLPGLSEGYDYDVIDTQALVERLSVEDEHLVLPDGVQYELLLLPDSETMPLPVLEKIHDLVQAGATILGPSPKTLPGLSNSTEDFARMKELVPKVWNSSNSHVHSDSTANTVLQEQGVEPDFEFRIQNGSGEMDWIHRKVGLTEVYFIRNESVNWIDAICSFRVTGKIPSLWSPDTGEVSPCLEYVENDHRTDARIVLPPWGSVFVVFETKEESPHLAEVFRPEDRSLPGNPPSVFVDSVDPNTVTLRVRSNGDCRMVDPRGREKAIQVSDVPVSVEVAGPWNVSFTKGWGAPPEKVFKEIRSWTDFEEEGIKYYSGTATYRKEIQIPEALLSEGQALCLDLGDVRDLARVRLNGEDLGILWKIPFEVEITQVAKRGANQLEIEVVNQWINRLAGDLRLPPEERFCRTNQTPFFKSIGGDEAWRIQPAGLLGPVELVPERLVEVEVDGFSASSEK
ncbi:MAG: hypothetical protein KC931_20115, partial [Candidatus Omnitrophica bacterium]|nr:hypothetical protein [Candidatus Omnitrophota bacterium]